MNCSKTQKEEVTRKIYFVLDEGKTFFLQMLSSLCYLDLEYILFLLFSVQLNMIYLIYIMFAA